MSAAQGSMPLSELMVVAVGEIEKRPMKGRLLLPFASLIHLFNRKHALRRICRKEA